MDKEQVVQNVQAQLFLMQDLKYRDFHSSLMPTIDKKKVIGVRTPQLRQFAKSFGKTEEAQIFMQVLPHRYYEENNLHSLLIQQIRDYDQCLKEMERFLPHIDNWATCDMLSLNEMCIRDRSCPGYQSFKSICQKSEVSRPYHYGCILQRSCKNDRYFCYISFAAEICT